MPKAKPVTGYLVVRRTQITRTPGGDPNDAVVLEPGEAVTSADVPTHTDIEALVACGAWTEEN